MTCLPAPSSVAEANVAPGAPLPEAVTESAVPVLLRGYVAHWPVVKAAAKGPAGTRAYLAEFDHAAIVPVTVGDARLKGRIFYDRDLRGIDAERGRAPIGEVLDRVARHGGQPQPPLIYVASVEADEALPGFRAENDVPLGDSPGADDPLVSLWIGTRSRIAAHNDLPRNLACVASGDRVFTLFPPGETQNLYPGPIENTPAGRPVSMVDFAAPDLDRFPRFAEAMKRAQRADMVPGDALFIPSMWWHHVEASGPFNMLVNYWWRTVPSHLGTPQDVLNHAMMTIRDLPPAEKTIWRDLFDAYVFGDPDTPRAHLPEDAWGILGPMTPERARRVRTFLLNRLNR